MLPYTQEMGELLKIAGTRFAGITEAFTLIGAGKQGKGSRKLNEYVGLTAKNAVSFANAFGNGR